MMKRLTHTLVSVVLLAGFSAPWITIVSSPQYAFAQGTLPNSSIQSSRVSGATANQAARSGGSLSFSEAAAGGAISVGGCLAAAGITIAAGFAHLGSLLGLSTAGTAVGGAAGTAVGIAAAVPVYDPANDGKNVSKLAALGIQQVTLNGELAKETVLDCIAWALAKMIWRAVAASIIDWINSGFNGNPTFITNLGKFMTGIADEAIGSILQGDPNLAFLCSPFSLNVKVALGLTFSRRQAPSCTFTQAMNNVRNFMGNFQQGGWPAWLDFTVIDANNPYGAYLLGQAQITLSIQTAQGAISKQLDWGNGFLSKTERVCNGGKCTDIVVTPGELIAKQASEVIGGGQTTLLLADELNEIISALVSTLLNKALESFSGLSQASSYSDSYYGSGTFTSELGAVGGSGEFDASLLDGARQIAALVNQSIQAEQDLQLYNLDAISIIQQSQFEYDLLIQCWASKSTPNSGSYVQDPALRAQASIKQQEAITGRSVLEAQKTPFTLRNVTSNSNVTELQRFIERADRATSLQGQSAVLLEFYAANRSGKYASAGDVAVAQGRITELTAQLNTQSAALQIKQRECDAFPETLP